MSRALAALPVERLAKLAGMLGSDHHGERANAAMFATRILKEHGWTWRQLIERATALATRDEVPPPQPEPEGAPWRRKAADCLNAASLLSDWERRFLAAILRQKRLSPRQREILAEIAEHVDAELAR